MAGQAVIVAGFGFRTAATAASLHDALERALRAAGVGIGMVRHLATASDKADAAAMRALAARLGCEVVGVEADGLMRQVTPTLSTASRDARGTGSVAEASALAAAGAEGRLLGPRAISEDRRATCALAMRDAT